MDSCVVLKETRHWLLVKTPRLGLYQKSEAAAGRKWPSGPTRLSSERGAKACAGSLLGSIAAGPARFDLDEFCTGTLDCSSPRCGLPHRAFSRCTVIDLAMSSGPPSQHSSHHVSTDQYSLSSSVCGSSIAGSEDKDSPMNTAEDITPGLLRCTVLCGIKVRAYEPLPRHCATGVIRDVDTTLTDEEIANNLRSPENRAKVQRSRSPSVDRRCQATFTSVMSGMQFHNSKRIHFNAASVAAMDIERQPASAARCANAAAARMRTETPALLKKIHESGWPELPRKSEGPSSTAQDTLATITENQVPERPTYAALTKVPKSNKTEAPPTKQGPISPDLIQLEDPTTSGNTPADPRKRRTPKHRYARFDTLFEAAWRKDCATFIAGDFNAPHPTWGYPRDTPKGRKLHTLIQQHNLTLLTDPSAPTRLGTSVARDTCPDLTLYRGTKPCTWHNLEEQLGSDHSILVTHINTKDFAGEARKIRITDWPAFRASSSSTSPDTLTDWVQTLQTRLDRHTRTLTTTPDAPDIDSHLLHLWEARRGLTKRWRRQRHNRKLKLRIAQLTVDAATYAANLTGQNWNTLCDKLNGTLGTARTWSLLRHLIQPGQAKSDRAKGIYKLLHATNLTDSECLTQLRQRYLPPPDTPRYADYTGQSLLATLGFPPCPASLTAAGLSPAARAKLIVAPIPRNMHPTRHSARRDHRSRYLRRAYTEGCDTVRALFTDASPQDARGGITVVMNSDLRLVHAATERGLTDVSLLEEHIPGNECAHALARELSNRAPGEDSATIRPAPFSYSTHLAELRLARQHYPPPQPSLTRRQGVLWRQIQTNTFPTPLFYSYVYPSRGPPECPHCGDRPTLLHMVWQCQAIPSVSPLPNRSPTSWEERLTDDTATGQQWLVDGAESVAATYGAPD
ncbi:hypothetical protein HPB47_005493 [Ixodes persulcatus]|uniref:Uncharacterized protein n=1 Tax=Ixodes persulcatus TaxID=34615 RepID=A0AC60PD45_IXOPE|nr:hypothetical protein HPB47_005493 [Ixodes persulcatus]